MQHKQLKMFVQLYHFIKKNILFDYTKKHLIVIFGMYMVPIIEVSSSDTSADLWLDDTCRDPYVAVSVCTVLPSSLYKLVSNVRRTELE